MNKFELSRNAEKIYGSIKNHQASRRALLLGRVSHNKINIDRGLAETKNKRQENNYPYDQCIKEYFECTAIGLYRDRKSNATFRNPGNSCL